MVEPTIDERYRGPWPAVNDLIAVEFDRYLADAERPELRSATTGCAPWTGDELTAHIVETFGRFSAMLTRARAGDFTPPFERDGLSAENHRAVVDFDRDPVAALRPAVEGFCSAATDPEEPMAHQFGPIPVGLQAAFGLAELALHHLDLVAPSGEVYRPDDDLVAVRIAASYEPVLATGGLLDATDPWAALLDATGRRPTP